MERKIEQLVSKTIVMSVHPSVGWMFLREAERLDCGGQGTMFPTAHWDFLKLYFPQHMTKEQPMIGQRLSSKSAGSYIVSIQATIKVTDEHQLFEPAVCSPQGYAML